MGARRRFRGGPERAREALLAWRRDFGRSLAELRRVLVGGGRAVLLMGDSVAGDDTVFVLDEVPRLARAAGLDLVARAAQARTPLGRERALFGKRGKREHLLLLEKP